MYRPPHSDENLTPLEDLQKFDTLFREQLNKIRDKHKGNKPPSVHVLGDFNFGDIVWPDRHNKCGSPLSRIEGQILVDIINDHGFDQLVHFPTREKKLFKKCFGLDYHFSSQSVCRHSLPRLSQ